MRSLIQSAVPVLALVMLLGCGGQVSETTHRQAQNRARLATSMLMEGEFAPALREARRAVELDPECVDCHLTLATIYGARGEFERAGAQLERVLEINGDNPYALNTLASVYLNTGRPAEAEPLALRAAEDESYTGRHLAFYNAGWARQEQQNYSGALESFGRALRESPRMCLAHYRIGEVYFRQRRFDDAIRHLEQAVAEPEEVVRMPNSATEREERRSCDDMPDVFYILGLTLHALDRGVVSQDAFGRCVELASEGGDLERLCRQHLTQVEPAEGQE